MGYYIRLDEANWKIPETAEVLIALKEMPSKYKAIQRGGGSDGKTWFSWIDDDTILNAETAESIFNSLGFETECENGSFTLTDYDNKTGQEDLFLAVIAPFCADGSYIEFIGEDHSHYRYEVLDGKMLEMNASLTWGEKKSYLFPHYAWEPGNMNNSRHRSIDIYSPEIEVVLAEIQKENDEHQAYIEEIRKDSKKYRILQTLDLARTCNE